MVFSSTIEGLEADAGGLTEVVVDVLDDDVELLEDEEEVELDAGVLEVVVELGVVVGLGGEVEVGPPGGVACELPLPGDV